MSGGAVKSRTHSGDLQPTTQPPKTARIVGTRGYPAIEVRGQIESGFLQTIWPLVNPDQIICNEDVYEINWLNRPLKLVSHHALSTGDSDFLESTKTILKPLASLRYDKSTKLWVYKDAEQNIDFLDTVLPEGFLYDMANSLGRGCVEKMLERCFRDREYRVINIGGGGLVNEPFVRNIHFIVSQTLDPPSRSSHRLSLQLPKEVEEPKEEDFWKRFVPNLAIEGELGEHLVVQVKKGRSITTTNISHLKYTLLPAAIKEKFALGLLICSREAILIKCWTEGGKLMFGESIYELEDLVRDLAFLLLDTNSVIEDLKMKKRIQT